MIDSDPLDEAVRLVRGVLGRSTGAPAANDSKPSQTELQEVRRRINLSFGQAILGLSVIPIFVSLSEHLDKDWSLIFGGFGFVLAAVGAFFIDRANRSDKAKLRSK
jgi:hypothetical protein